MNNPDPIKAFVFCHNTFGLQVRTAKEFIPDTDHTEGRYIAVMIVPIEVWEEMKEKK